jgi:uncharacterized membrane protein YjjP (DUF1212 family)
MGGIVAGILCLTGGIVTRNITDISFISIFPLFYNRIILGFMIGISNLRLHYLINGAIIGFLVSLISSLLIIQENIIGFILFTTAGILYGALIDWAATKIFKVPA